MDEIKKYLKENYVPKKEIEKIINTLCQEFHKLDNEIDIRNHKIDDGIKIDMMQEIGWVVGQLEILIGKE